MCCWEEPLVAFMVPLFKWAEVSYGRLKDAETLRFDWDVLSSEFVSFSFS